MRNMAAMMLFCASSFVDPATAHSEAEEPKVIACIFEKQPLMIMIVRGGMGATDNTLQIGQAPPVSLEIGSSLSIATRGTQEFVFSLRPPASVTVNGAGSSSMTYGGECISTVQPPASQG